MSRSRFTISYSRRVLVSSSTSNANLAKSPPVTAISISLVLLKSPLALEPKKNHFFNIIFLRKVSDFFYNFRSDSCIIHFYKPHIQVFILSALSYHIILSFLSPSANFRNYFLPVKKKNSRRFFIIRLFFFYIYWTANLFFIRYKINLP